MTPVERAAKALYERAPLSASYSLPEGKVGLGRLPWEQAPEHERGRFIRHVVTVLQAIREPLDEAVAAAGVEAARETGGDPWPDSFHQIFCRMIDAMIDSAGPRAREG